MPSPASHAIALCLLLCAPALTRAQERPTEPPLSGELALFRAALERALRAEGGQEALLAPARARLEEAVGAAAREAEALLDREAEGSATPAQVERREALERAHDLAGLELLEGLMRLARALPEADAARSALAGQVLERHAALGPAFVLEGVRACAAAVQGEALLELGRAPEALLTFRGLAEELEAGGDPGQDDARAVRRGLLLRALRGQVRAGLAQGAEAAEASLGLVAAARRGSLLAVGGWEETPEATLLQLELCKARALTGDPAGGCAGLLQVIEAARAAPPAERLPGIDLSPAGVAACAALAELVDLLGPGQAAALPPPAHLAAATGYLIRRRPELALPAWKTALALVRDPAQRASVAPVAAWEAAALLLRQERWLEAALALEALLEAAPESERAPAAARAALAAARRGSERLSERGALGGAMRGLLERLTARVQELDPEAGLRDALRAAAELETRGEWRAAAERYLAIGEGEPGPLARVSGIGPLARARAGSCLLRAWEAEGAREPGLAERARGLLEEAHQAALAQNDALARAAALVGLARYALRAGQAGPALALLRPFDEELAAQADLSVRRLQASAHLTLGEPEAAEARFAQARARAAAQGQEAQGLSAFALSLAEGLRELANGSAEPARALALRRRAAQAAAAWEELAPPASLTAPARELLAALYLEGGAWEDAARAHALALEAAPAEGLPAQLARQRLEERRAWALVRGGRWEEGGAGLRALRDAALVTDLEGRPLQLGRRVQRVRKGPFPLLRAGRRVEALRWVWELELPGGERTWWWEVDEPLAGGQSTRVVEGSAAAPPANWSPGQERRVELHLRRSLLLVDGLSRAAWSAWEAQRDQRLLAGELTEAVNELRLLLRGIQDQTWTELACALPLGPPTLAGRRWEADLLYLRIKLAREQWAEVASDIRMLRLLQGGLERVPEPYRAELVALEQEASRASQGR